MDITFLGGKNFSGRTVRLREWVGLPSSLADEVMPSDSAYVGADASMALSGLAPTVAAEFQLVGKDLESLRDGQEALEELGLQRVLQQNPFTLSGGEQVAVAIIAAALGRPKRIAIDCALEQLAAETRNGLIAWLEKRDGALMIADNRLDEWYGGVREEMSAPTAITHIVPYLPAELRPEPISLEIVDLCFGYSKDRLIFDNLNTVLDAGQSYHLRGANGAGKTTLSKLICGLLRPTRGEIRINGAKVEPWRKPGRFVSYHFQNPAYQLFASSIANQLQGASEPIAAARNMGIDSPMDLHPLDLPFVLRKRLALASTIFRNRHFLIADEPTLGQDDQEAASISTILGQLGGLRVSHSKMYCNLPIVEL